MNRDFKAWMMGLIFGLPVFLIFFIAFLYFGNCGFNNDCSQAGLPPIYHTPIPTIHPAGMPVLDRQNISSGSAKCIVSAEPLLSAWVDSNYPENEPFVFMDNKGATCQATFSDLQILFSEANIWYSGALACVSCHNSDIAIASAQLDLSSYAGIIAGSRRTSPNTTGNDILGGGNWDISMLRDLLFILKQMPLGRLEGAVPAAGPVVQVGEQVEASATETPAAPVSEVPRPSNPGNAGEAINLTGDAEAGSQLFISNCTVCHGDTGKGGVANSGSTDGTIPALNPIDPLLVDPNFKIFATNLDLFIQHGSIPAGTNPVFSMPAWGNSETLSQQQIADLIAYIISLIP
jgi:mono/diheme cytochrome c family protein